MCKDVEAVIYSIRLDHLCVICSFIYAMIMLDLSGVRIHWIYWAFMALQIPWDRKCAPTECGHVAATFSRGDAGNLHLCFIESISDDKSRRTQIRIYRPLRRGSYTQSLQHGIKQQITQISNFKYAHHSFHHHMYPRTPRKYRQEPSTRRTLRHQSFTANFKLRFENVALKPWVMLLSSSWLDIPAPTAIAHRLPCLMLGLWSRKRAKSKKLNEEFGE